MAWDEYVAQQASTLSGYIGGTFSRWAAVMVKVRDDYLQGTDNYKIADFFVDLKWQAAYNWETLEELSGFPGFPVMPTVPIPGKAGHMNGAAGEVFVNRSLVGAAVDTTDLVEIGGTVVSKTNVSAVVSGDLMGKVTVTLTDPVSTAGTYRGVLLAQIPPRTVFEPIAWIVAVANP